jgi:hypothetical protein
MIDRTQAMQIMSNWLTETGVRANFELSLLDNKTLEVDFGWVFFYTSKLFRDTGDFHHAVTGNAPVIVDRTIGSLHITGAARPIEHYIEDFRNRRAMVGLQNAAFVGQPPDENFIPANLPRDYLEFLRSVNGCVVHGGGLHIRGSVRQPDWHSLQRAWTGENRLSALYPAVQADDIPFAEDFLGDQFLLRSNSVFRLNSETGDIEDLELGWQAFFNAATANPIEFLSLQLLGRFHREGGALRPGELLSVYPPLCTKEAANGVSLKGDSGAGAN